MKLDFAKLEAEGRARLRQFGEVLPGSDRDETRISLTLGLARYIERHFVQLDDLDGATDETKKAALTFRNLIWLAEKEEKKRVLRLFHGIGLHRV